MVTLRQLMIGTQKLHPKAIDWAPDMNNAPLMALEIQVFKGMNSIVVSSQQRMSGRWPKGERPTSKNGIYKQTMRFTGTKEQVIGHNKLSASKDKCSLNCGCDNQYYMWWWANKKVKAHEGSSYKPYVKVPGSTREPLNPLNIPGMCKHLVYLVKELKRKRKLQ